MNFPLKQHGWRSGGFHEEGFDAALKLLVAMSQKMSEAAAQGEWESVIDLESQRRPQLELFFSMLHQCSLLEGEVALVRDSISQIMDLDNRIATLAEAGKATLVAESRDIATSRKAVNAYLDNL